MEVAAQEYRCLVKDKNTYSQTDGYNHLLATPVLVSCGKKKNTTKKTPPWQTTPCSAVPSRRQKPRLLAIRFSGHPWIRERHAVTRHWLSKGMETNPKKIYFGKTQLKEMKCRFEVACPTHSKCHGTVCLHLTGQVAWSAQQVNSVHLRAAISRSCGSCGRTCFAWPKQASKLIQEHHATRLQIQSGTPLNHRGYFWNTQKYISCEQPLCSHKHLSLDTAPLLQMGLVASDPCTVCSARPTDQPTNQPQGWVEQRSFLWSHPNTIIADGPAVLPVMWFRAFLQGWERLLLHTTDPERHKPYNGDGVFLFYLAENKHNCHTPRACCLADPALWTRGFHSLQQKPPLVLSTLCLGAGYITIWNDDPGSENTVGPASSPTGFSALRAELSGPSAPCPHGR